MHPRYKHWHMIDYVIVRQKEQQDMWVTKAICGADCRTDHRLVLSKLKLHIQPKWHTQGKKTNKRLNTSRLNQSQVKPDLVADLDHALQDLTFEHGKIDDHWSKFRDTVYSAAYTYLGKNERKHQDLFDVNNEEIQRLLKEKRLTFRAYQQDITSASKKRAFNCIKSTLQAKLQQMQDSWLIKKAEEIQIFTDKHDYRKFYESVKTMYRPQSSRSAPLLSADGSTLLTEKSSILNRWVEHFNSVLNRSSSINTEAIV